VARRRARRTRRYLLRALLGVVLPALLLGLAALGWLLLVYPRQPGPGKGRAVQIELVPGISPETLAARLAGQGALSRPRLFALYLRALGADGKLRGGAVMVRDSMSPRALLQRVAEGFGSAEVRVTLVEGSTRFDMARELERWSLCRGDHFLRQSENRELLRQAGIDAPNAEGYLFPDTYRLDDALGARELVRRLLDNFRRRVQPLLRNNPEALPRLKRQLGWGLHEVVILASIVEKEAAIASERPLIAGVFLNRLLNPDFKPHRLQADPTAAYGCLAAAAASPPAGATPFAFPPSCSGFDGKRVTRSMMQDPANPYNTYRHEGLPPGPIANPGLDSIRAVLSPARHDFLYFVVSGGGAHRFSATLGEHGRAVEAFRAKGGGGGGNGAE
jgi:UPF0755 protein